MEHALYEMYHLLYNQLKDAQRNLAQWQAIPENSQFRLKVDSRRDYMELLVPASVIFAYREQKVEELKLLISRLELTINEL